MTCIPVRGAYGSSVCAGVLLLPQREHLELLSSQISCRYAPFVTGVSAILSLLLCRGGVPHHGGRKIERIDVDDLEIASNSRIPANPNPC